MEGVPELEGARTGGCQNWRVPELEGARTGGCQNWRVPGLEGARTGGCQNWRVPELEGARTGGCPYWRKVPILEQGKNLSFSFPHTNIFNIGSARNFPA